MFLFYRLTTDDRDFVIILEEGIKQKRTKRKKKKTTNDDRVEGEPMKRFAR